MKLDAFWLPKSVVADANTIQMPTLQVRIWAENADVGVSQWAAAIIGIWQSKGGLTTQQIDIKVRELVWEMAQSISIVNKHGAGPEEWDLLIDRCVTPISNPESIRLLRKQFMAPKTNRDIQKLLAALDKFADVYLCQRKQRLEETPTTKSRLVNIGIYFIALMLL
jgi:hypothetical protein